VSETPKVSVVIPAYNRERYLADAIDSVLAQTFTDFEILIVDDGSRDRTVEIAQSYRDPRIRIVRHERNRGVAAARNTGVAEARGAYVAFLDSDDVAYPDRLARQVAFLDSHPDYAAVGAWIDWMSEDGRPLGKAKRKPTDAEDIAAQSLFWNGIQNTAAMARRAILGRYPLEERFEVSEDFDLWARIAADHKVANLPCMLVRARAHDRRTTQLQAERTRAIRGEIVGRQLRALGIEFTDGDLDGHLLLRGMRKQGFRPDRAYLDWAEGWLSKLRTANADGHLFPEPAFSRLLGTLWLKACWQASGTMGWRAWRRFLASPLRTGAWAGLWREIAMRLPRPFASPPRGAATAAAAPRLDIGPAGQGTAR
jgi:glycosyltransferase involved in cell wall biosynthesis